MRRAQLLVPCPWWGCRTTPGTGCGAGPNLGQPGRRRGDGRSVNLSPVSEVRQFDIVGLSNPTRIFAKSCENFLVTPLQFTVPVDLVTVSCVWLVFFGITSCEPAAR